MSAVFILEYAGAPVRFLSNGTVELVPAHRATPFTSEPDAWCAAYNACLPPWRCQVVNLHDRQQPITVARG